MTNIARMAILAYGSLVALACCGRDAKPTPEPTPDPSLPTQGQPCPDKACAEALTCVEYAGIGGPAVGMFTSCEIPCADSAGCPAGQQCVTIADGPGQVCRP